MNPMDMLDALASLLERSALAELEYRSAEGWRVRLARAAQPATSAAPRAASQATAQVTAPVAAPSPAAAAAIAAMPDALPLTVQAGVAGLFCIRPAAEAPAFVRLGDVVDEGQTLAVIEAMKVLNAVESPRRGRIVRILAEDQSAVAAATPLFVLEPLEADHV